VAKGFALNGCNHKGLKRQYRLLQILELSFFGSSIQRTYLKK